MRIPLSVGKYQLWLYPVCNPSGYADGTRQSRGGRDLNREFWKNSAEPEVQLLERELQGHRFNGIISLHCDDVTDGVRGFVNGASMSQYLLKLALAAAERALPSNAASRINGFHAFNGIIASREDGAFQAPPEQKAAPFEIALEVPQRAPLQVQAHTFLFALHEILATYRRISFADEA
jgi:murein peptide amidase A